VPSPKRCHIQYCHIQYRRTRVQKSVVFPMDCRCLKDSEDLVRVKWNVRTLSCLCTLETQGGGREESIEQEHTSCRRGSNDKVALWRQWPLTAGLLSLSTTMIAIRTIFTRFALLLGESSMCADAIRPWVLVFQVEALDFTFPGMNRAFDFVSCLYIFFPSYAGRCLALSPW